MWTFGPNLTLFGGPGPRRLRSPMLRMTEAVEVAEGEDEEAEAALGEGGEGELRRGDSEGAVMRSSSSLAPTWMVADTALPLGKPPWPLLGAGAAAAPAACACGTLGGLVVMAGTVHMLLGWRTALSWSLSTFPRSWQTLPFLVATLANLVCVIWFFALVVSSSEARAENSTTLK